MLHNQPYPSTSPTSFHAISILAQTHTFIPKTTFHAQRTTDMTLPDATVSTMNALKLQEPAPNLIDMPTEILCEIFSYLSDPSSLFRLMLVCSRFHAIAEPLLYSHIDILVRPLPSHQQSTGPGTRPFNALIQRLEKDPILAQRTTHLSISLHASLSNEKGYSTSHKELIKVLPNLKELTLRPPPRSLEAGALTTGCPINIIIDFADIPHIRRGTEALLRSYAGTTVRKLEISHYCFDTYSPVLSYGDQSDITDLRFMKCSISQQNLSYGKRGYESLLSPLSYLLRGTKALHRLWLEIRGSPAIHVESFLDKLLPHAQGLEDICIVASGEVEVLPVFSIEEREPPGCFSIFTYLKRLTIPTHVWASGNAFRIAAPHRSITAPSL